MPSVIQPHRANDLGRPAIAAGPSHQRVAEKRQGGSMGGLHRYAVGMLTGAGMTDVLDELRQEA